MAAPALTVFEDGGDEVTGDNLNTFCQTCDNYDDLRAFVGTPGLEVFARGRDSVGDGYSGMFYWAAASTGTDDDLTIITPTGQTTGRWLRNTVYTAGIVGVLTGSRAIDFPSTLTARMGAGDNTITVAGAAVGDWVECIGSTVLAAGGMLWGVVSAADVVTVYYVNLTGGTLDIASMTVYVKVTKRG